MPEQANELLQALQELLTEDLAQSLQQAAGKARIPVQHYLARVLQKAASRDNAVYLNAPVSALVEGLYRQSTSLQQLRQWGDFGLGTFNDLDGEMLLMDGTFHQMRADGQVFRIAEQDLADTLTPFACVTFFQPDTFDDITPKMGEPEIFSLLDSILPSPNMLFAIRVEGRFSSVRVRSVPRQESSRPLVEVAREQPEFSFENATGTMVGFYTPPMMQGLSVPGLHLHFLDAGDEHGGHLLSANLADARIGVQHVPRLVSDLPVSLDFLTADLTRDTGKDLDEAER